jgi:hypothetical protein
MNKIKIFFIYLTFFMCVFFVCLWRLWQDAV